MLLLLLAVNTVLTSSLLLLLNNAIAAFVGMGGGVRATAVAVMLSSFQLLVFSPPAVAEKVFPI